MPLLLIKNQRKKQKVLDILNSEGGLPTTRAYDGCISAEMVYNEESNTAWIVSNWATNDHYLRYLDWRMNSDQYKIVEKMTPLMEGGENGLVLAHTNSNYSSY